MKTLSKLILALTALTLSQITVAQTGGKIGFVNLSVALQSTAEVKQELDTMSDLVEQRNQQGVAMSQELDVLRDNLAGQAASPDPDTVIRMREEVRRKEIEFQRFQQDAQQEINRRRDGILRTYGQKLQALIPEYSRQHGYVAIFLLDHGRIGYVKPEIDLTGALVTLYDQRHPPNQ